MRAVLAMEVIGLVAISHRPLIWPLSMAGRMSVMNMPRCFGKNSGSMPQNLAISSRSFAFSSAR
jgi:hypothetical protein